MKKISFLLISLVIFISISKAQDQSQQNTSQVTAMAFTYDDQKMVSGCEDGTIQVWNGEGKLILTTHVVDPSDNSVKNFKVTDIRLSPDGSRMLIGFYAYNNFYFLLDNKGNTLKGLKSGDYAAFSSDCNYIFIARREYQKVYCFDKDGNQVYELNVTPQSKNPKNEDPYVRIEGMSPTRDGGMYIVVRLTMNEKKELYDYWIYEYDKSKALINRVQVPLTQKVVIAYFNATPDGKKAFIHGWYNSKNAVMYESYLYKYPAEFSPSPIRSNYNFYYSHDGNILKEKGYTSVSGYSIPNLQSGEDFFISGDRQKVVVAYKGKPLEMHSIKEQSKLFEFDNSNTVEDTYVYNAPTQQNTVASSQTTSNPKIDLSGLVGLKAESSTNSLVGQFDVDFERGYGGTTVWKISGVSNSDIAAQGIANFITMHNLAFEAKLNFTITDVSTRHSDYVSINFWIRKIPNDSKGRYESYSVRAYQDGWVQLVHLLKNGETIVASKNLVEKVTFKTWVYGNMTLKTSAKGDIEVYINGGGTPVISINVPIVDDGSTSELTVLQSSSAGILQDLHVSGYNIVRGN